MNKFNQVYKEFLKEALFDDIKSISQRAVKNYQNRPPGFFDRVMGYGTRTGTKQKLEILIPYSAELKSLIKQYRITNITVNGVTTVIPPASKDYYMLLGVKDDIKSEKFQIVYNLIANYDQQVAETFKLYYLKIDEDKETYIKIKTPIPKDVIYVQELGNNIYASFQE